MTIEGALVRGDFAAVNLLGHNMRGSGGGFGFPAITDIGAGLELALDPADIDAARRWVAELSGYLDLIESGPGS